MDWVALRITQKETDLAAMERRLEEILANQKVTLALTTLGSWAAGRGNLPSLQ